MLRLVVIMLAAGAIPERDCLAQTPIAEARDLPVGATVTVRGIVTNGSELGSIRYMQDATGGIAVFPGPGSAMGFSPQRGTDITVTGPLKLFNGLLEIDPVQAFTVHATGIPLPSPQVIAPGGLGKSTESELVRINACTFMNAGGSFTNGTLTFTSNGQQGTAFLRSGHPMIGGTIPSGIVDIIGVVSRFSTSDPPTGGYQLLPRTAADILVSNTITISGGPEQTDIQPTGFNLRWTTNLPGNARVRYGPTPAMGSLAAAVATGTEHSVQLSGLQPARAYHAQPFSVQGTDTAFARTRLYSTASADPGEVRVYFNKPVDASVAQGPVAMDIGNAMADSVKAHMDRAGTSIDVAVYNTTSHLVVSAANNAHGRGVRVRWIAEPGNSNSALSGLHPDIPVLYRPVPGGSGMHNKFVIIDPDGGPAAYVLTGSANFTNAGFIADPNNLVIIRDMALARAYRTEFEEMWGGTGDQPDPQNSRFGAQKTDNTPHLFNVNGTMVQSWFSPSDGTTERIVQTLNGAKQSVEFALFVLTSSTLTEALTEAQARPGVVVRGIVEEEDMNMNTFNMLLAGGVDVRTDGAPYSLHHKYAVVDRASASGDPLVITGSHNWSFNAENQNDENTLIIHSASIADQFHQEWSARWTTAVNVPGTTLDKDRLTPWPNPVDHTLNVALPGHGDARLWVTDALGRVVLQWQGSADRAALDTGTLAAGTYTLVVVQGGQRSVATFIRTP